MKTTKKLLSVMLTLVMLFTAVPFAFAADNSEIITGECGTNLTWSLNTETGVLFIGGEGEMDNYSLYNNINKTNAPWWDYYSSIKSLEIGDEVLSIGNYAFYRCASLVNLNLGKNLRSIGTYAFSECKGINNVIIPDSVTVLSERTFSNSGIYNLTFGDGLTEIGKSAFSGVPLHNIEWGENLKVIGDSAFSGRSDYNYGNIIIPSGVEIIKSSAFGSVNHSL